MINYSKLCLNNVKLYFNKFFDLFDKHHLFPFVANYKLVGYFSFFSSIILLTFVMGKSYSWKPIYPVEEIEIPWSDYISPSCFILYHSINYCFYDNQKSDCLSIQYNIDKYGIIFSYIIHLFLQKYIREYHYIHNLNTLIEKIQEYNTILNIGIIIKSLFFAGIFHNNTSDNLYHQKVHIIYVFLLGVSTIFF